MSYSSHSLVPLILLIYTRGGSTGVTVNKERGKYVFSPMQNRGRLMSPLQRRLLLLLLGPRLQQLIWRRREKQGKEGRYRKIDISGRRRRGGRGQGGYYILRHSIRLPNRGILCTPIILLQEGRIVVRFYASGNNDDESPGLRDNCREGSKQKDQKICQC